MRVAFWNTNRNAEINPYIRDLAVANRLDIVILAEYTADVHNLEEVLYKNGINMEQYTSAGCDRITLLGKYKNVEPCFQNTYCSLQIINDSYILGCVHLPSKLHCDRRKKDIAIRTIVQEIQELEESKSCERTIIVGDFNENPYELGCLAADGFHGIPDYIESKKKYRTILEEQFKMFYNPMWNLLGDFSFPTGTFFYNGNEVDNPFWNIFDQVMIRPCLRNQFLNDELKIIYKAGDKDLIDNRNRPCNDISDHLPIVFEIKED